MKQMDRRVACVLALSLAFFCVPAAEAGWVTFTVVYETPCANCMLFLAGMPPVAVPLSANFEVLPVHGMYDCEGWIPPKPYCIWDLWRPLDGNPLLGFKTSATAPITQVEFIKGSWSYFGVGPGTLPATDIKGLSLEWKVLTILDGSTKHQVEYFGGVTLQPYKTVGSSTATWSFCISNPSTMTIFTPPKTGVTYPWLEVVIDDLEEATDSSEFPWDLRAPLEVLPAATSLIEELEVTADTEELRESILGLLNEIGTRLSLAADVIESIPPDAAPAEWEAARAFALEQLVETWHAHRHARSRLMDLETALWLMD